MEEDSANTFTKPTEKVNWTKRSQDYETKCHTISKELRTEAKAKKMESSVNNNNSNDNNNENGKIEMQIGNGQSNNVTNGINNDNIVNPSPSFGASSNESSSNNSGRPWKKAKKSWNFFMGLKITDLSFISKSVEMQKTLQKIDSKFDNRDFTKLTKFHITLFVLHIPDSLLNDNDFMLQFSNVIHECYSKFELFEIAMKGIGHFGNRVLFASLDDKNLNQFIQLGVDLQESIRINFPQIELENHREILPHITLWKQRGNKHARIPDTFFESISEETIVGTQKVRIVDLLHMNQHEDDHQYYRWKIKYDFESKEIQVRK